MPPDSRQQPTITTSNPVGLDYSISARRPAGLEIIAG
jgi:hypothetical protein